MLSSDLWYMQPDTFLGIVVRNDSNPFTYSLRFKGLRSALPPAFVQSGSTVKAVPHVMLDIVETPVGLSSRLQQLISFDDYILFGAALTELGIHRGDLFYARFSPDREIAEIIPFPRVK